MKVQVLEECGFASALLGLGLSYGVTAEDAVLNDEKRSKMLKIANRLYSKDGGHNKFLESIQVWLDITASRYWWQEFDTYRIGVTKQSESTMHTITKKPLCEGDFEGGIPEPWLRLLNMMIKDNKLTRVKCLLPESFLQRRIISTNYKVLRHIIFQRSTHRLPEWHQFINAVRTEVEWGIFLS